MFMGKLIFRNVNIEFSDEFEDAEALTPPERKTRHRK